MKNQGRKTDMDFNLSEEQTAIRENVTRICNNFDDSYWLACDREGTFPDPFASEIADNGWYGVTMDEEYGGANRRPYPADHAHVAYRTMRQAVRWDDLVLYQARPL
tara:strand:- start:284 stop:601 length:318 start_codon:yes stop_codon:yes gene_type:complete